MRILLSLNSAALGSRLAAALLLAALVLSAACTAAGASPDQEPAVTPPQLTFMPGEASATPGMGGTILLPRLATAVAVPGSLPAELTPQPGVTHVPGKLKALPTAGPAGFPAVLVQAQAELARALGLALEQVSLVSVEAVEWPDACLGAAQPNEMCAEVIVPGYLAVFTTPGGDYEVHSGRAGLKYRFVPPLPASPRPASPTLGGESTTGESGVEGQVMLGPACPGPERADAPCPDQPYQARLLVADKAGAQLAVLSSDDQGYFRIALLPGEYVLSPQLSGAFPRGAPQAVVVYPGRYTRVTIKLDSGMR